MQDFFMLIAYALFYQKVNYHPLQDKEDNIHFAMEAPLYIYQSHKVFFSKSCVWVLFCILKPSF